MMKSRSVLQNDEFMLNLWVDEPYLLFF